MEVLISELVGTDVRIMNGVPCFRVNGVLVRIPIFMALENLADSGSMDDTLDCLRTEWDLQELTLAHIQAAVLVASVAAKGYWETWRMICGGVAN